MSQNKFAKLSLWLLSCAGVIATSSMYCLEKEIVSPWPLIAKIACLKDSDISNLACACSKISNGEPVQSVQFRMRDFLFPKYQANQNELIYSASLQNLNDQCIVSVNQVGEVINAEFSPD